MDRFKRRFFLSFDCATKTFAFSICMVDMNGYLESKDKIIRKINAIGECDSTEINEIIHHANAVTSNWIKILDGETVDLVPDKQDKNITSIERLRSMKKYVTERVIPAVDKLCEMEPLVMVEFQMGPNAKSRTIASGLVTMFSDYSEVVVVGPSLKNRVYFDESGRLCNFMDKYANPYSANKAQSLYSFEYAEKIFGSPLPPMNRSTKGHIADSFMQVIGWIIWGCDSTGF